MAELHESGRIHFHGVTYGFNPPLTEARNPNTNRLIKKNGQIYNAPNWNYGFSTVSIIQDRDKTASYIAKYITKDLMAIPTGFKQPRYFVSRGLKLPEIDFLNLSDQDLAEFTPAFISGEIDMETLEFSKTISIYNLKENSENDLYQDIKTETTIKSKIKSKVTMEAIEVEKENN